MLYSKVQRPKAMKSEINDKSSVLWKRLESIYDKTFFDKEEAKNKIIQRVFRKKRIQMIQRYSVAASILLVIGLSFLYFNTDIIINNKLQSYYSDESVREINLPDGSTVWLNSNSTLSLPENFSSKHRKLFLKGEAFFEVHKDKDNSFRVFAGNSITEVLGTSFNIKSDTITGNTDLMVNSGKVAFYSKSDKGNKTILAPGESAVFNDKENNITMVQNPNLNAFSWKTGILKFYNTPITEVCKDLSKYFKKEITCNIQDTEMKLTGTFYNDSLEEILTTIKITLDTEIKVSDNQYLLQN